jgi:hypothetical protein
LILHGKEAKRVVVDGQALPAGAGLKEISLAEFEQVVFELNL